MDFLDDTTRVDTLDEDDGDVRTSFFPVDNASSPPATEPLFLDEQEPSDDDVVEIANPSKASTRNTSPTPEALRPTKRRRIGNSSVGCSAAVLKVCHRRKQCNGRLY